MPRRRARGWQARSKYAAAASPKERTKLFGDIQRMIATDAVNVFIFNPAQVSAARKGLKGLWSSSPIFANDMAAARHHSRTVPP